MNPQQEFYTKLIGLAGMVPHFTLTKETIGLYDQHLEPLGYERVCSALDRLILERDSRDPFPSIKDIRMVIDPELDPDQEAVVIASRISGAVARVGPYQVELAKQMVGDVGWKIVQCEGGWENVCQTLTYENQSTLKAQWRNLAKTFLSRSHENYFGLPGPKTKGLESFGNVLTRLIDSKPNNNDRATTIERKET